MFGDVGIPHGFCFLWNPGLLWLHVVSDLLIALAYFLIPIALLRILRGRKDIAFNGVFFCFAAFIVACGVTHVMEVVTLWQPIYWVSGILKAITAAVSILTLVVMVRISPGVLAMPHKLADRRYEELIRDAPDAILQVDPAGLILIANRTAETMFGYTHDELLGSNVDRLIPLAKLDAHPQLRASFAHAKVTRPMGSEMGDLHAVRKDGTKISVEVGLSPVETDAGPRVTAVVRDVSDRRRIEHELERERATRVQRIEVLARFSAGIAHEMKNPLAIIHGRASDLAEMADAGDTSPTAVAKACASILKTSDRAMRILRGLAAIAREGANDPMQKADVASMIQQAFELVETRYRTHGIALTADVASGLPPIECREAQIGQILMNLLNNAFDAVDASTEGERWVRVRASADTPERILIDVSDGGPKLSPEIKERLMETFFTTKPLGGGLGIGLSVSRSIAKGHGGTLQLLNGPRTCFRLSLPVQAVPEPAIESVVTP